MVRIAVWLLVISSVSLAGESTRKQGDIIPFTGPNPYTTEKEIDRLIAANLRKQGLQPALPCSDEVFMRRVYLDVIGTLPEPQAVRQFLRDKSAKKRTQLIDRLLSDETFAEYGSLKWGDLLRIKAEFPINLWPNAVQAYHRWLYDALRENKPYDVFARELLTSSGSNFRVAPVNFYRAIQGREPSSIATAVGLTFMGVRVEHWPEERRSGLEAFFSRVAFKGTAEWKEEIVYLNPEATEPLRTVFPDWTSAKIAVGQDPRVVFADWLITAENPWFGPAIVNRIWAWLFGRGIVHEPDDMRKDNPPVHPEVLSYLQRELVTSGWDLRHIYRLILNSRTYQQSSIPRGDPQQAEMFFACYPVRRLEAEVLIDALCWISGTRERYSSPIPEPFTFIPEEHRSIALADGSITSQFLEMFGRPSRDTGQFSERNNNPTAAQSLHLLNSSHLQEKIDKSWRLSSAMRSAKGKRRPLIDQLYLIILSRFPTDAEFATTEAYFQTGGISSRQATQDVAWALINSKEFLYRH
jgi:hypothetical protein